MIKRIISSNSQVISYFRPKFRFIPNRYCHCASSALATNSKVFSITAMNRPLSTSRIEELLGDPKRHFDYDTLISRKKDGPTLVIDVREPAEVADTGLIPGSINIPLNLVEEALAAVTPEAFRMRYGAEKPSKGMLIVFSCRSGRRSLTALGKALSLGYLNASHYKGGWMDWEQKTRQR